MNGHWRGGWCQWQNPDETDVAQWLAMNRTPMPVPSQRRSTGRSRKAVLPAMASKLGLRPPVSARALSTTMPPELNCAPRLPATLLRATSVRVAPSSKMPTPRVSTGVSSFLAQNLFLRNTLLPTMVELPAPFACPSSTTTFLLPGGKRYGFRSARMTGWSAFPARTHQGALRRHNLIEVGVSGVADVHRAALRPGTRPDPPATRTRMASVTGGR
jgi:hypothetical protein